MHKHTDGLVQSVKNIHTFMYLVWRLKLIAPHELCLIEEGWSWHPFINLSKTHLCKDAEMIFFTLWLGAKLQ